jgi:hypothetical protein
MMVSGVLGDLMASGAHVQHTRHNMDINYMHER